MTEEPAAATTVTAVPRLSLACLRELCVELDACAPAGGAAWQVWPLALVSGRARHHRWFWLTLPDDSGALVLALSARVLAIGAACAHSRAAAAG